MENISNPVCPICLDEHQISEMLNIPSCRHRVCKPCFENYLRKNVQANFGKTIKCPVSYCKNLIDTEGLKETFSPTTRAQKRNINGQIHPSEEIERNQSEEKKKPPEKVGKTMSKSIFACIWGVIKLILELVFSFVFWPLESIFDFRKELHPRHPFRSLAFIIMSIVIGAPAVIFMLVIIVVPAMLIAIFFRWVILIIFIAITGTLALGLYFCYFVVLRRESRYDIKKLGERLSEEAKKIKSRYFIESPGPVAYGRNPNLRANDFRIEVH